MALGTPYVIGQGIAAGTSAVITPGSATGAGDCLVACLVTTNSGNNISGVADSVNGAWALANPASTIASDEVQWYILGNAKSVSTLGSVTVSWSGSGGVHPYFVFGIPGAFPSFDIAPAPAGGTSTTPSVTSGTLDYASQIVLLGEVHASAGGAPAWAAPWTQLGATQHTTPYASAGYQVVSSTASVSGGPTIVSAAWGAAMLTIPAMPLPGTPYVITQGHAGAGSSTLAEAVVTPNAAGDCLAAFAYNGQDVPPVSVSDPVNGAWQPAGVVAAQGGGTAVGQWFIMPGANVLSTGTNITASYGTSTAGRKSLSVFGCPGISTAPLDLTPPQSDVTSTAPALSVGSPSVPSEVILAAMMSQGTGGTPGWGSPFTQIGTNQQPGTTITSYGYDVVSSVAPVSTANTLATAAEATTVAISLAAAGLVFQDDVAGAADAVATAAAVPLPDVAGATDSFTSAIRPQPHDLAAGADAITVSGKIVIGFTPAAPGVVIIGEKAEQVTAVPVTLPPASPAFILSQMPRMHLQNIITGRWLKRDVINISQPLVTWTLNGAGTFTCALGPPDPDLMSGGNPALAMWQTACYLEESGEIKFGGILTDMAPSGPSMPVTFTQFTGYASGMPYEGPAVSKTDYEALDAVRYLWSWLQSQTDGNIGLVLDSTESGVQIGGFRPLSTVTELSAPADAGDTLLHIVPLPPGSGGPASWTPRALLQVGNTVAVVKSATNTTITLTGDGMADFQPEGSIVGITGPETPYALNWFNVTDIAQEISAIQAEAVFDFWEQHYWSDNTRSAVTHRLHFGVPRIGRRCTDLRFAEGENIVVPATSGSTAYANNVIGMGAGQGTATVRATASVHDGRLRRSLVYQDQTMVRPDRLASRVATVLASVQHPEQITQVTVRNHPNATFGSFGPGDDIPVTTASGWQNGTTWSRITQMAQDPTTQLMTLTLARSDSFTYQVGSGSGGTV